MKELMDRIASEIHGLRKLHDDIDFDVLLCNGMSLESARIKGQYEGLSLALSIIEGTRFKGWEEEDFDEWDANCFGLLGKRFIRQFGEERLHELVKRWIREENERRNAEAERIKSGGHKPE